MPGPNQQTDSSTLMFDPSSIVGGSPNVGALKQGLNLDTSIGNMGGPAPSDSIDLSPQSILKSYEDVGKRQAQLETQKAQSTADIARDYAKNVGGLLSQAKNSYQEPPQFQPTKEETGQLIGLAGTLAVFGALMGGKGNLGSIGAINAMAGMINGYKQGRTDLFNQEKQKYDENMKQVQAHNSQVRQILQDGLEKAKVDLSSAQAEAESKLAAIGADNIKALAHQSGLVQAYNMYNSAQEKALNREYKLALINKMETGGANKDYQKIKGQVEQLKNIIGDDVNNLGSTEIPIVSNRAESAKETKELADLIQAYPKASGVVGKTISSIDKFMPSRYDATTAYDPASLNASVQNDKSVFSGIPEDQISAARAIQKKVLDVINARTRAVSNRFLVSEFYQQNRVLDIGNMSAKSAYDVYNSLADGDIANLRQYLNPESVSKIKDYVGINKSSSSGKSQSNVNLPKPQTQEEFDKLPKGQHYIDPDDGKEYVK